MRQGGPVGSIRNLSDASRRSEGSAPKGRIAAIIGQLGAGTDHAVVATQQHLMRRERLVRQFCFLKLDPAWAGQRYLLYSHRSALFIPKHYLHLHIAAHTRVIHMKDQVITGIQMQ